MKMRPFHPSLVSFCLAFLLLSGCRLPRISKDAGLTNPYRIDPATGTLIPENGFVPDEATATAIAVAVWTPLYGKQHVRRERPYHASLKDGVWTVRGSVDKPFLIPRAWVRGGGPVAKIDQKDGHIIRVFHYK